jgi:hypothetical protein
LNSQHQTIRFTNPKPECIELEREVDGRLQKSSSAYTYVENMGTRTIAVSDEAYTRLASLKREGESSPISSTG